LSSETLRECMTLTCKHIEGLQRGGVGGIKKEKNQKTDLEETNLRVAVLENDFDGL